MTAIQIIILIVVLGTIFLPFPIWYKKKKASYMPFCMGIAGSIVCSAVINFISNALIYKDATLDNITLLMTISSFVTAILEVLTLYLIIRYFGSKFSAKDCVSVGLGFGMALTVFQFFKLKLPALVALKSIQEGSFVTGWVFLFINALYYTFWTLLFVSISILIYMGIRKRDKKEIIIAFILELVALLIPNMFNRVLGSFSLSLGKFLLLYLFYFGTIIVVAIICLVKGIRKKNIWISLPYIALAITYKTGSPRIFAITIIVIVLIILIYRKIKYVFQH